MLASEVVEYLSKMIKKEGDGPILMGVGEDIGYLVEILTDTSDRTYYSFNDEKWVGHK